MKREFLEELGLSRELIDRIISEHGKSTEALRNKCTSLEETAKCAEELSAALEGERAAFSAFRSGVIAELVDGARPSSALARAELIRRLSEVEDGSLNKALSDLRVAEPDAFLSVRAELPVFSEDTSVHAPAPSPIPFSRIR